MNGDDDKLLDQYLSGDSELSRCYRDASGDEGPPEAIDERLRAAARREAKAGPRLFTIFPAAWTRPLAAAAVIVLAVGVVLQMVDVQNEVTVEDEGANVEDSVRYNTLQEGSSPQSADEEIMTFEHEYAPPVEQAPRAEPREQAPRQRTAPEGAPDGVYEDPAGSRAPAVDPDPQAWLEHIRGLMERGQFEAARLSVTRFKNRFPQESVPRDLLEQLDGGDSRAN